MISAFALPYLQRAAMKPAGQFVSKWEYFLLQLPWLDSGAVGHLVIASFILAWMAYLLSTLVSIAESQFVNFDD